MFGLAQRIQRSATRRRSPSARADILWLTNIPTPYTVPVWRELSTMCRFQVACAADNEHNRAWTTDTTGVNLTVLAALKIRLGYERIVYGPSLRLARLLSRRPHVVVIDGWESAAALQTILMAKALRIPVLISYWSTASTHRYNRGPVALYRRWFFQQAQTILTPGVAATAAVLEEQVDPDRIVTGIATVDVERFAGALAQRHR